ncbi:metal-dependent amidase/aminoacylase/carboxypeptidase [Cladorrhinum sp. PSN332]|nr:metal-dependent amidase/aminoacylase/carboxypeptidase [Cladorrhinum sp. PSN332]
MILFLKMSDSRAQTSSQLASAYRPDLTPYENLYRQLHSAPELSRHEAATAAIIASTLQNLPGIDVKTGIGGHGVVGILRNGPGPTVLLRAELDALPVQEQTGLPYASVTPRVMHACGHDLHMTALLASAHLLHRAQEYWTGTLVFLFQPDEETGAGAQSMVDDGLYDELKHAVPHPTVVLGGHVMPMRAGSISTRVGAFNSSSESVRITLYGHGGHGAKPHKAIDPVVMACSVVLKLQTIVSREMDPMEAAVVTVGSIQAGIAPNVIPDEATILVNFRSFSTSSQEMLRNSITRIVNMESATFGAPKPPLIKRIAYFPLLFNDPSATITLKESMSLHFGAEFLPDLPASPGSEDISNLATPVSAPVCFWNYGGISPEIFDAAPDKAALDRIPANHNASFAPVVQPTLTVATDAYAVAALTFLELRSA